MQDIVKERRRSKEELHKQVVDAGGRPARNNMFHCPFHNDTTASSWIKCSKDGFYYFRCFTCNKWDDVWGIEAHNRNMDVRDLIKEATGNKLPPAVPAYFKTLDAVVESLDAIAVEEINQYTNPTTGNIDLFTIRYLPRGGERKQFAQGHQTPAGFIKKRPAGLLPLFNRIRLNESDTVIFVEGEKCVRALTQLGFVSTTGSGGASNALAQDYSPLAGKTVFLWGDYDEPGNRYMEQVREKLLELSPTPTVYIVDIEALELPAHGDVVDLIDRVKAEGGTAEDIKIQVELALSEADESSRLESLETLLDDMRTGRYKNFPIYDMPILTNEARMLLNKKIGVMYGNAGFGKSLFISKTADDLVLRGYKVARLQLEDELELHLLRSFAQQAHRSDIAAPEFHEANPEESERLYSEYKRTLDTIAASVMSGENDDWNVDKLLKWVETKLKSGVELIIIDPVSVIMTDKVWLDSHKLVWGLKRLLAQYPNGRVLLVAHPNDNGEVGGGKAYRRFCHTLLILNKFKTPKEVTVINARGAQEIVTAEASIGISKTRYGKGNGLEIAVKLNPETLCIEELGVILVEHTEASARPPKTKGRDLEAENKDQYVPF
jgi:hypothetical protein